MADGKVKIELDVKGTPGLKSSTKAVKDHDKALKKTGKRPTEQAKIKISKP